MNYELWHVVLLLLTGAAAGIGSGMIGVGGGFLTIPVQYWLLSASGINPDLAIRIALGTNLLVVIPTSLNGALAHHRKGAVLWKEAVTLGLTGTLGAYAGAAVASRLPERTMTLVFGIFLILLAVRMLTAKTPETTTASNRSQPAVALCGFPFGIISGMFGVAGGGLLFPVLVILLKINVHKAVGTSTATMIFFATGGALSFSIHGLGVEGLPPFSTGYINWLQWALLSAGSVPMAILGVRLAHRLPALRIRQIFAGLIIFVGLRMSGAFEYLGLPL
jgi:uncharacterized protein